MNKFLSTEWDLVPPAHNWDVGHDWLISATVSDEDLNQTQYHLAEVSCDKDMTEKDAKIVATAMSKVPELFSLVVAFEKFAKEFWDKRAINHLGDLAMFVQAKTLREVAVGLIKSIENPDAKEESHDPH